MVKVTHRGDCNSNAVIIRGNLCIDKNRNIIDNNNDQQIKYPKGYVYGLQLNYLSATQINVLSGVCRDFQNTFNIVVSSTLTIDITNSGTNGLDTGSESVGTWYAVHVIADSNEVNGPAGLLSLNSSEPTLPTGYDVFRRIGWIRNNLDGNIKPFIQKSNDRSRKYCYDTNRLTDNLMVIANGQATAWTTLTLNPQVPPNVSYTYFQFDVSTSDSSDDFALRPTNSQYGSSVGSTPDNTERTWAPKNIQLGFISTSEFRFRDEMCTGLESNGDRAIDYVSKIATPNGGIGITIYVTGFEDCI